VRAVARAVEQGEGGTARERERSDGGRRRRRGGRDKGLTPKLTCLLLIYIEGVYMLLGLSLHSLNLIISY
jgi:hypothetical protein